MRCQCSKERFWPRSCFACREPRARHPTILPIGPADPDTGCALFDATLRPGDTVSWSGACKDGRAEGPGTARFSNNGAEFESFTGNFPDGVAADGACHSPLGRGLEL